MKKLLMFTVAAGLLTVSACSKTTGSGHDGKKTLVVDEVELDSITINADSTGMYGNFMLMDSSLVFVDITQCKIFAFSLDNGELLNTYSQRGQGPGDMQGVMYGTVIEPDGNRMLIVNSSAYVYEFDKSTGEVKPAGRMGIYQDIEDKDNYESPECYFAMTGGMDDLGVTTTALDDTTLLVPVVLNNRNLTELSADRYEKGHILAHFDPRTMRVRELKGSFPQWYKDNPMPAFEFFDYAVEPETGVIYVSHGPDSLIYRYDRDYNLIGRFGLEPQGTDRSYTRGFEKEPYVAFREDIKHVGANTGLYYDPTDRILFRTTMTDFPTGRTILQGYRGDDMIMEQEMPAYFKMLGRYGDRYYGVRFKPAEDEDNLYFNLYSFRLK